ncbi:ComEC/Rec2 family competence protein [Paenibacillus soyae]|uniref:ComEC/Rec2 family competence protein n=1 Tax=Paenibacillus soyae TaxID=2969249 RepID=A0A9X2S970_9BACL|nr:ComEC/Rec2 family competence protein [Paenibacillus soyae]MCR2803213.1 ComEC/Rec2 family competence protein [Paenibacillus soyae]
MRLMDRRPLVWFATCFVAGSAAAAGLGARGAMLLAGAAALLAAAAVLGKQASRGVAIACLIGLCLAAGTRLWADARNVTALQELAAAAEADGPRAAYAADALGTIVSAVEIDGDRVTFRMEAHAIQAEGVEPLERAERLQVQLRLSEAPELEVAAAWQRGDEVRVAGELSRPAEATNSGGFDYRRYLRSQGIHWLLKAEGAAALDVASPAAKQWSAAAMLGRVDAARAWLGTRLGALYPAEQSGYMQGLILGIREDLDPEQFNAFARLGLTHILAISGLHVAVFMYAFGGLMKLARQPRERILTALMFAVPLYVLLAGASPSVLRAGVMAVLGLIAARLGKLKDGLHLLAAAAVLLLLYNPYYLDSVSFQLSFLVTLGLIVGVPPVRRALPRPRRGGWLLDLAAVTLVAQLVSFPVTLYYFNQFHLLSLLANFILVPFISFIVMPAGTAAMLLGFVWEDGAGWLAGLSVRANEWSFALVDALSKPDGLRIIWATPPLWWVMVWLLLMAALFRFVDRWNAVRRWREEEAAACEEATAPLSAGSDGGDDQYRRDRSSHSPYGRHMRAAVGYAAALIILLLYAANPYRFDRSGTVSFLDVGQGDAALIRTPAGKHILIDGGGAISFAKPGEEWRARKDPFDVGAKVVVPLLMRRGVSELDLLVVSHLDSDHIKGLHAVLEQIPVKAIWWNGSMKDSEDAVRLMELALDSGIPLYAPADDDEVELDYATRLKVLWPVRRNGEEAVPSEEDQNEHSLVVSLSMYGYTILFPGDISSETERLIVEREQSAGGEASPITILKVAHHGSRYSTSEEWLAYLRPLSAVASVSATNTYGHPHPDVISRLGHAGAALWRTDLEGEARFRLTSSGVFAWKE